MKTTFGSIIGFAVLGYLVAAAYRSYKNGYLTLPFFDGKVTAPPPASTLSPELMANRLHALLVEKHGAKAMLHAQTRADRDITFRQLLEMPNDYLASVYEAYNRLYKRDGKGTITRVINEAYGDPGDWDKTKPALVQKLRGLNLK